MMSGVTIEANWAITQEEKAAYRNHVVANMEKAGEDVSQLKKIKLTSVEDDAVSIDYFTDVPKFERIRRITGYLVGTTDRWNNAKRAEEKDRKKHA